MDVRHLTTMALAVVSAAGCTYLTPRENFETGRNAELGRHIDNLGPGARLGSQTRTLANGHREYTYDFSNHLGPCVFVREVDGTTNRIVAWRIEGDDRGCQVPP